MQTYTTILEIGFDAFDTKNLNVILNNLVNNGIDFLIKLLIAVIVFFIGKKIIKLIVRLLEKYFERSKIEVSVAGFLTALIRSLLYIALLAIIIFPLLGVASSSIVALIGSAGLSIGFALQGGLSNFAGGVLILILKPFKVGDYIISGANEGTVTAIDIFYTKLLTFDNKLLVMPNGALANGNIINVSNEPTRRLEINVLIDYSENIQKVKDILLNIGQNNELVLKEQDITVFVTNFDPSAIKIGMRVWVANENFWILKWQLLETIKNEFDTNKITIPFDQLDVNIRKES
ncbi:MAG: MscS Mechanosensitive ion channel [Anaerocolumna sp.]|jgi:small conductance mechanosensitive channel|nr:MscS Mechanosensitive ion channel [Anaerocolumna sp.]